jgi:hypothetical protein
MFDECMKGDNNNSKITLIIKFNCCKKKKKTIEFKLSPNDEIYNDIKNILIKYPELLKNNNIDLKELELIDF